MKRGRERWKEGEARREGWTRREGGREGGREAGKDIPG